MYFLSVEEAEQKRMAKLLASILDINDLCKDVVLQAIEHKGIDYFLENPNLFGLPSDICVKVGYIKTIIETLFKEGVELDGY